MRLQWNRAVELGIKRGVLYRYHGGEYPVGVAWNGLLSVAESTTISVKALYSNNRRYGFIHSTENYGIRLGAIYYPEEFSPCVGEIYVLDGVLIGQQRRQHFGFSWVTEEQKWPPTDRPAYKLHIVWHATARLDSSSVATVNTVPVVNGYSWDIDTTQINLPGYRPMSHMEIDSLEVDPDFLAYLEDQLYGCDENEPYLPSPEEVILILRDGPNGRYFNLPPIRDTHGLFSHAKIQRLSKTQIGVLEYQGVSPIITLFPANVRIGQIVELVSEFPKVTAYHSPPAISQVKELLSIAAKVKGFPSQIASAKALDLALLNFRNSAIAAEARLDVFRDAIWSLAKGEAYRAWPAETKEKRLVFLYASSKPYAAETGQATIQNRSGILLGTDKATASGATHEPTKTHLGADGSTDISLNDGAPIAAGESSAIFENAQISLQDSHVAGKERTDSFSSDKVGVGVESVKQLPESSSEEIFLGEGVVDASDTTIAAQTDHTGDSGKLRIHQWPLWFEKRGNHLIIYQSFDYEVNDDVLTDG